MLAAQLGIVLSVLAATAHIAKPASLVGSGGSSPGITAAWFPNAAVHVKPASREGFRLERIRHIAFPPSLDPAGVLVRGPVPPPTLRPEMVHGGPRRSPLHHDIALRAPPFADRFS
jgi:hypothetical protein